MGVIVGEDVAVGRAVALGVVGLAVVLISTHAVLTGSRSKSRDRILLIEGLSRTVSSMCSLVCDSTESRICQIGTVDSLFKSTYTAC